MDNFEIFKQKATLWLRAEAALGEGPVWIPELNSFLWIDILKGVIYCTKFPSGKSLNFYSGYRPSSIVQVNRGKYLISDWDSIFYFESEENSLSKLVQMSFNGEVRFNDGKVDPYGNFWIGSMMVDGEGRKGSLYRFIGGKGIERVLDNISISNGMVWSSDKKTMYYIDTSDQVVYAFDFSKFSEISNKRTVIEIPEEMGAPDGMTIDKNGNLWIALWGGYGVIGCDPVSGKIIDKLSIDVPLVTSCAFGGKNLDILMITTAKEGLSQEELQKYPNSGNVYFKKMNFAGTLSACFNLGKKY